MLWFFQWNSFQWNVLYASINSDNLPVFYSQQLVQIQMLLINVVPFPMWFISFTFSLSLPLSFSRLSHFPFSLSIAALLLSQLLLIFILIASSWEWTYPKENLTSNLDIDIICISICWFLRHARSRLGAVGWFFPI